MDARDHLDQRRLARAVVADEGHHLSGVQVQREILNGGDAAKGLADVLQLQDGRHGRALRSWGQGSGWPKIFSMETTWGVPVETPAIPTA